MCITPKVPEIKAAPQIIASPRSAEGVEAGAMEARLRRARASAASRIITSPVGIPAGGGTAQLGAPA
ncbi:hypothetical protein [Mameliella alba]|uniref:hypothetical protein n=1 Tax=Mameliella alba TaxID=561184 RepID=UPI000B53593A|nr:hypothetical protein [Mameliella alba]OWV39406.1 hypothetical protein CDZ95_26120 [Mameliella alba]